mmetsp:Transcript_53398/g.134106  ORF Transcript_53398/g.134106 Transcript_53398/m.134106 type:complete len:314 (+) Transcript_53398:491-1432(+)
MNCAHIIAALHALSGFREHEQGKTHFAWMRFRRATARVHSATVLNMDFMQFAQVATLECALMFFISDLGTDSTRPGALRLDEGGKVVNEQYFTFFHAKKTKVDTNKKGFPQFRSTKFEDVAPLLDMPFAELQEKTYEARDRFLQEERHKKKKESAERAAEKRRLNTLESAKKKRDRAAQHAATKQDKLQASLEAEKNKLKEALARAKRAEKELEKLKKRKRVEPNDPKNTTPPKPRRKTAPPKPSTKPTTFLKKPTLAVPTRKAEVAIETSSLPENSAAPKPKRSRYTEEKLLLAEAQDNPNAPRVLRGKKRQ